VPHDRRNIITFDMGGTSCDVALIKDGEPRSPAAARSGRDLAVPMMDINTRCRRRHHCVDRSA
jgi:N-methylhydantoinase A